MGSETSTRNETPSVRIAPPTSRTPLHPLPNQKPEDTNTGPKNLKNEYSIQLANAGDGGGGAITYLGERRFL